MVNSSSEELGKDENAITDTPLTTAMVAGGTPETSPAIKNFALITIDILRIIFEKLSVTDLARAACVCRFWNSVASDPDVQTASFKSPWKLKDIVGDPSSRSFWKDNSLSKFAISHRIDESDSVAGLAVKYSVQAFDIKCLNRMISDHGMCFRERLLIPITDPNILINATCYIELDPYAKRELAVLYLEGGPIPNRSNHSPNGSTSNLGKPRVFESDFYEDLIWEGEGHPSMPYLKFLMDLFDSW